MVQEDRAGGKWYVEPSPINSVRVKATPHEVRQPIEVIGSNVQREEERKRAKELEEERRGEVTTASDDQALAAVYDSKRWQNKFFTGHGVTEERGPVTDSLTSSSSQQQEQEQEQQQQQQQRGEEQGKEPRRKGLPVLSHVRPAPGRGAGPGKGTTAAAPTAETGAGNSSPSRTASFLYQRCP